MMEIFRVELPAERVYYHPNRRERRRHHTSQQQVFPHTTKFLENLLSRQDPYNVLVRGIDIVVHPGVFPPTTDTHLLANRIHCYAGMRVLDLGTGSGALAAVAGKLGASGMAVDINPLAISNAEDNFRRLGLTGFCAVQSDLFNEVPEGKYELIVCNFPPYDGEPNDMTECGIYGGRRLLHRFFEGVSEYQSAGGQILLTCAEWSGNVDFLQQLASEHDYLFGCIGKAASGDMRKVYRLYSLFSQ